MDTPDTYATRSADNLSMSSSMISQELSRIRIAVISNSVSQRKHLKEALENVGLNVVMSEPVTMTFVEKLSTLNVDVILLDLDEHHDHEDILDELLDNHSIPIIFNDVSVLTLNEPQVLARWYGKLLKKISSSVGKSSVEEKTYADHYNFSSSNKIKRNSADVKHSDSLAKNVWVLGASLGGPDAVKEFFKALPADLPVTFILAQHLGANFVGLLAEQLNHISDYEVLTPAVGHVLRHKQVILTPVSERLKISPIGAIELEPIKKEQQYSPSINMVLEDMSARFGKNTGAIIFSGMGDDGLKGCQTLYNKGSMVWTQSQDSCVIGSMPDNIDQQGLSSFSGSPAKLAEKLFDYLRAE